MTRDQAKEKIEFLIEQLAQHMKSKIDTALNSGAIDLASFEDNYYLPKIITYAITKEALDQTRPLSEAVKDAENLYHCI